MQKEEIRKIRKKKKDVEKRKKDNINIITKIYLAMINML